MNKFSTPNVCSFLVRLVGLQGWLEMVMKEQQQQVLSWESEALLGSCCGVIKVHLEAYFAL
jgi:hypothetical protein